jgi:hypothetical protein
VAVYRARVVIPLFVLALGVAAAGWLTQSTQVWAYGAGGAVAIGIRRRRAVIFSSDAVEIRPIFGEILRIPFSGVRSACVSGYGRYEEAAPTIHMELVTGGAIDTRLCGFATCAEIVGRIDEAARASG